MKAVLIPISILALIVLFVAPTLHALGMVSAGSSRLGMLLGTVGWFASAVFWIRPKSN